MCVNVLAACMMCTIHVPGALVCQEGALEPWN